MAKMWKPWSWNCLSKASCLAGPQASESACFEPAFRDKTFAVASLSWIRLRVGVSAVTSSSRKFKISGEGTVEGLSGKKSETVLRPVSREVRTKK